MDVVYLRLEEITPYENNPRVNADAVPAVAESIRKFGFRQPIVLDANRVIVTGHTRYKAAKSLGMEEVPCIIASDLTDEQIRAYRIADNKVGELSSWDEGLLGFELSEIPDGEWDLSFLDFGDLFSDDAEGVDEGDDGDPEEDDGGDPDDGTEEPGETFEERHRVEKGYSIVYEIGFENEEQQEKWYQFLRDLKAKYPEDETIAARIMRVVDQWESENG